MTIELPTMKALERKSLLVLGSMMVDMLRLDNEKSKKIKLEVVALAKRNESNSEHFNAITNVQPPFAPDSSIRMGTDMLINHVDE